MQGFVKGQSLAYTVPRSVEEERVSMDKIRHQLQGITIKSLQYPRFLVNTADCTSKIGDSTVVESKGVHSMAF